MSLPGRKEKQMIDGERHIYSVASGTHYRITENHKKSVCIHPRILTNINMRNSDCRQQEQNTKIADNFDKRRKGEPALGAQGNHGPPAVLTDNAGCEYRVPRIYSTLQVAEMLIHAKEMQPNMPQLLKAKLNSPSVAAELKSKVST